MLIVRKLRNENAVLSIGDYTKNLTDFAENGILPADVEKIAQHRIELGQYHEISWTGTRTTNLFISHGGRYWLAEANISNLHAHPELIQSYHENDQEIPYSQDYVTSKIEMFNSQYAIPTNSFAEYPVARFLFKDQVESYADWLKQVGIPAMPIHLPTQSLTRNRASFIRPIIIRCTDNWSGLITANADLYYSYGYRGSVKTWNGEITKEEQFTSQQLRVLQKFIPLEDRNYTLSEVESLMTPTPFASLLNPLLRFIRNGGSSNLPANYGIFVSADKEGN